MDPNSSSSYSRRVLLQTIFAAWMLLGIAGNAFAAEPSNRAPLEIWFIRHGESEINVAAQASQPDGGVSYPLTRKGVSQVVALTDALAATPIVTIYTSTYLRAVQTADAIAFKHGLTLSLAPEAVEIDLGIKRGVDDARQVYLELGRQWLVDKDINARHREGESFADVQKRFLPFVRELMNRHVDDSGVVVVVAHSATLAFMLPMLASNIPADFGLRNGLPNTGIIKTELRDNKLFCTEWAGIASTDFAR